MPSIIRHWSPTKSTNNFDNYINFGQIRKLYSPINFQIINEEYFKSFHSSRTISLDFESESTSNNSLFLEQNKLEQEINQKLVGIKMNNKNEKSPEGEKRSEINIVSQQIAENNYSGINETTKNNNNISRESSVTYSTRNKCNGNSILNQKQHPNNPQLMDSSPSTATNCRPSIGPSPLIFSGESQFDTRSLQTNRRSLSFSAHHHHNQQLINNLNNTPNSEQSFNNQRQQPLYFGSCSNLSLIGNNQQQQLVIFDGQQQPTLQNRHSMILPSEAAALQGYISDTPNLKIEGIPNECEQDLTIIQRHLNIFLKMTTPSQPIWYNPIAPPPPPFYYTATNNQQNSNNYFPQMLDFKSFKQAVKESERFEKKQQKLLLAQMGEDRIGDTCCEFCCGGSALILWLVISLVSLGFLGFLLMVIYFI
uniref:Uncharacterized protein n=2 Tax=Meloidogyne enterolobii TaxID=390850 RepID=A0A6V7VR18_MELEN|nr:unnamed protein product [Meloidogyne enterolobii]